ncbi:HAD-IIIA family hydrolase [Lachnospiraceae bacterium 42-17]
MIKMVIFDIDGVLTDGAIIVDSEGREQKKINLKDVDALFTLKKQGYILAAVTGEDTEIVKYFEQRFPWDYFYKGIKKKTEIIQKIIQENNCSIQETCYIGDGKYDVEALRSVGLGVCPADAVTDAKVAADMILHNTGGQGCVWELKEILKRLNHEDKEYQYFYDHMYAHISIFKNILSDYKLVEKVMRIGKEIVKSFSNQGQLFLCGNGGSAADSQHIATEFVSRFYKERPGMNAEALTVNTSTLTAVGNDYSFERIFVRQLEAKAKPGDILVGISTSGRSKNVIEGLHYAKERNMCTVMLMGDHHAPELNDFVDYIVKVPSKDTPRIQEAHIFIGHLLAEYVEAEMINSANMEV